MSPAPVQPDSVEPLTEALVDVVDALDASLGERLERLEARLVARARSAAFVALLLGVGFTAAAVSCVSANVALGALVAAHHGTIIAAGVVSSVNIVVVGLCVALARVLIDRPPPLLSGGRS